MMKTYSNDFFKNYDIIKAALQVLLFAGNVQGFAFGTTDSVPSCRELKLNKDRKETNNYNRPIAFGQADYRSYIEKPNDDQLDPSAVLTQNPLLHVHFIETVVHCPPQPLWLAQ